MSQSKIAKYYIACILGILLRSYVLSMPQTQPPDSGSAQLQARIMTGTWPIRKVVANSLGDLVFAGGDFHQGPDGLVLVTPNRIVKIAATGDAAPQRPGLFLQSFGLFQNNVYTGDFSFNDRHDLAFTAFVMNCNGPSLEACGVSPPAQNGLFLFSESSRQTIAISGDPAPGTDGGVFGFFQRAVVNKNGGVLFAATIRMPVFGITTEGLFLFSANGIDKVYVTGDPSPVGPTSVLLPPQLSLSDDGAAIFVSSFQNNAGQVLLRYQNGTISKLIAAGDSLPGRGALGIFFDVGGTSRGDIVFRANSGRPGENESLLYMGKDGNSFKIIGSGEPTSGGDVLQFWGLGGGSISRYKISLPVRAKINDSSEVLFASPFQHGGAFGQGLFLFSPGEVGRVPADGDLVPGRPDSTMYLICCPWGGNIEFSLNNLGMAVFSAETYRHSGNVTFLDGPGAFLYAAGGLSNVLPGDDAAPGTDGESFTLPDSLSLGNSGQVGLHATVCCGN